MSLGLITKNKSSQPFIYSGMCGCMWRKDHPENISTGWKASEKWRETKWGFANKAAFLIFIEII